MAETNPNGANQYQLDPRQKLCWNYYTDPKSDTFSKVTQSAIKAGYEESYADSVGSSEWFCAYMWRLNASLTGEKKLKQLLELDLYNGGDKIDVGMARIHADLAKFITSTQGKDDGWASRNEVTGKDGAAITEQVPLTPELINIIRKAEDELKKTL